MAPSPVDVTIIGGGPAGATAAIRLKQIAPDLSVLLVERDCFPRFKVCGCCLNGAAANVMEQVGAAHILREYEQQRLTRWKASFRGRQVTADLPTGWAISRQVLDQRLLQEAESRGVSLRQPCSARVQACHEDALHLSIQEPGRAPSELTSRYVILATGLAGMQQETALPWKRRPAGPIGAGTILEASPPSYQSGTIYMASGSGGYAGLVRLESGALDVAAALYDPAGKQKSVPIGVRVSEIIREAGMPPVEQLAGAAWKGTPPLHRQRIPGRGRLLAVGDTAGYIEPFTGEGMAWAMRTGMLAADVVVDSQRTGSDAGTRYIQLYRKHLSARRLPCRVISSLLRQKPTRRLFFSILTTAPWLARPVVASLNRTT